MCVTVDLYRDTPLRLLGYANEVGEAFRNQMHVRSVYATYAVATAYCIGDMIDKTWRTQQACVDGNIPETHMRTKMMATAADTLLWQAFASVIIPGFTINRVCHFTGKALKTYSKYAPQRQKMITSAIGLSVIPLIVKPIDHSVDFLMDNSLRLLYANDVLAASDKKSHD